MMIQGRDVDGTVLFPLSCQLQFLGFFAIFAFVVMVGRRRRTPRGLYQLDLKGFSKSLEELSWYFSMTGGKEYRDRNSL